jgi:hypothetical protein
MDEETKTTIREWLVGQICTSAEGANGIPFLRIGTFGLWIPSAWRVTVGDRIVASSNDDDVRLDEILPPLLVGQKVQSIDVRGPFHDLVLSFESRLQLGTFSDSKGYENWTLLGGPAETIIAGPGDSWSVFSERASDKSSGDL